MTDETLQQSTTNERRGFLGFFTWGLMGSGLAASYGTFCAFAGRFLFPAASAPTAWQFVTRVDTLEVGETLPFTTPLGAKVVVARQAEEPTEASFIALSSVCPHLGCAVHWEAKNERFFCPCHNGAFDASGNATEGPPVSANQQLARFPLKVDKGLLFIEVPTQGLGTGQEA